jgi:TatA/E family protein of Tat protein translocase
MNLGFPEMIFLFLFALILFGPKKLPEIGRQIGRALNEFKRASNEFRSQVEAEISQLDLENTRQTILPPIQAPAGAVASGSLPMVESSVAGIAIAENPTPEISAPEIPTPEMPAPESSEHHSRSLAKLHGERPILLYPAALAVLNRYPLPTKSGSHS